MKDSIRKSREEALRLGTDVIDTEHLLLGLLKEKHGLANWVLNFIKVDVGILQNQVEKVVNINERKANWDLVSVTLTKSAHDLLKWSVLEAEKEKMVVIGTEHMMLAFLRNNELVATQILNNNGIEYNNFKDTLKIFRKEEENKNSFYNKLKKRFSNFIYRR